MCRFSSGNWFFCTKFVQLAMASKRRNTVVNLQKEFDKLDLTAAQYFSLVIIMIGPDGLLLVVPM
jgi:hypothetical protein